MKNREQTRLLFEAYNRQMEQVGEDVLSRLSGSGDVYTEAFEKEFRAASDAEAEAFFNQPLEGLDAGTPAAFIKSLLTIDACMDVFIVASEVSDDQPPRILIDRLRDFGEEAVGRLRELALSGCWDGSADSEDFDLRDQMAPNLSAVLILGQWRDLGSIRPILEHFSQAPAPDDYVSDIIAEYAENMGDLIVPELRRILDTAESIRAGSAEESLLVALSKAGAKHRTDEIYQSLRAAFRKMDRKVIGALCLGDYGDARAISLLKGFLDRNKDLVDRELFYETLTVIRKLGGDITDIEDPFGDYSKK